MMTGGGPAQATEAINLYAYEVGFSFLDIAYASSPTCGFHIRCSCFCSSFCIRYYEEEKLIMGVKSRRARVRVDVSARC